MSAHVDQCVDVYCHLAHTKRADLKTAATPFIDESRGPKGAVDYQVVKDSGTDTQKDRRLQAEAKRRLEEQEIGALSEIAAKCLMKVMYMARYAQLDCLRAVQALARYTTMWTRLCDRKLHRVTCYLNSSRDFKQIGFTGGPS